MLPPPPPPYIVRNSAKKCPQARVAFEKGIVARDFSPVQGKVPPCYTSCFLYRGLLIYRDFSLHIPSFLYPVPYLIFHQQIPCYTVSNPYNSELPVTMLLCLYPSTFTCSPTGPGPLLPPWEVTYLSACLVPFSQPLLFLSLSLVWSFLSAYTLMPFSLPH